MVKWTLAISRPPLLSRCPCGKAIRTPTRPCATCEVSTLSEAVLVAPPHLTCRFLSAADLKLSREVHAFSVPSDRNGHGTAGPLFRARRLLLACDQRPPR